MRSPGLLLLLPLSASLFLGCGYRFSVGGPSFPEGIASVYVPVFENRSSEPEAGALFADALSESLARDGKAGGPLAPARIEGVVVSLSSAPAATQRDGQGVGVYRVVGRLLLRLSRDGTTLCAREVQSSEDYLPSQNLLGLDASRRQAIRRLARRMMESAARDLCPSLGEA